MRSLAANISSIGLHSCLMLCFKSPISLSIGMMTLNGFLPPSMRHQRVYVDDILDGRETLEEEKGRCGGGLVEGLQLIAVAVSTSINKCRGSLLDSDLPLCWYGTRYDQDQCLVPLAEIPK
jgi:hypothetical protein